MAPADAVVPDSNPAGSKPAGKRPRTVSSFRRPGVGFIGWIPPVVNIVVINIVVINIAVINIVVINIVVIDIVVIDAAVIVCIHTKDYADYAMSRHHEPSQKVPVMTTLATSAYLGSDSHQTIMFHGVTLQRGTPLNSRIMSLCLLLTSFCYNRRFWRC